MQIEHLEPANKDNTIQNTDIRIVYPLQSSDQFFDLLQNRLSTVLENILFNGDHRFTIFFNIIDRKKFQKYTKVQTPDFIYGGWKEQKHLLEAWNNQIAGSKPIQEAWQYLSATVINSGNSEVSSSYYQTMLDPKKEYNLENAGRIYFLKNYFAKPTQNYTKEQEAERAIITSCFNIEEDLFISLPLIKLGELEGFAHIVFKKEILVDQPTNNNSTENPFLPLPLVWKLLRTFIAIFDDLFLDWTSLEDSISQKSFVNNFLTKEIHQDDAYFDQYIEWRNNLTIFNDLKLKDYYRTHASYFLRKLGLKDDSRLYQQYIINAVTAILIDSYAHNVSAHALSTLAWWFTRQADFLADEELDWDSLFDHLEQDPLIDKNILGQFRVNITDRSMMRIQSSNIRDKKGEIKRRQQLKEESNAIRAEDGKMVIRYPGSFARELKQLMRFLMEKGAYWGGVTRDNNVGGKESSLYSVLWYDFIRNPLFTGTIAKTEDITKIKLHIIIYDPEPKAKRPDKTLHHKLTYQPENSGILAEVDLSNPRKDLHSEEAQSPHEEVLSVFVKKGKNYTHLRKKLKEIRVFFPGGVVGRHAFLTMIENEIRNVKHYKENHLKKLQQEGLTVVVGVHQCSLHNSVNHELYRIYVWLDAPTQFIDEKDTNAEHLLWRKWKAADGNIFNEKTFAPHLGGIYQDKICGSFLMNGRFSRVQSGDRNKLRKDKDLDTQRDEHYYPWVRPACSPLDSENEPNTHLVYKISYNNPTETKTIIREDLQYLEDEVIIPVVDPDLPKAGYLKKVFYLWRSQLLMEWKPETSPTQASWDNPARFNIVVIPDQKTKAGEANKAQNPLQILRRNNGVVRVVKGGLSGETEEKRYAQAYKRWLNTLLGNPPLYAQTILREGNVKDFVLALKNDAGKLHFKKNTIEEGHQFAPAVADVLRTTDPQLKKEWEVLIAHRENESDTPFAEICVRYRNHGIYKSHFLPENAAPHSSDDPLMMELFEVLATKVCIFDNRVHHRLRLDKDQIPGYHDFLRDKLKLGVFKESSPSPESGPASWLSALKEDDLDFLKNCHFLVMHLSFIESILPSEIPNISSKDRSNVGLFLEKYIMPLIGERENFFFVVTTGRGRNEWWTSLDEDRYKDYSSFTLFRAIESLLTAIENSVSMKDDVELKYRIVKILYGS